MNYTGSFAGWLLVVSVLILSVEAANVALVNGLKVASVSKQSATVAWNIDRSQLFHDVGLTFTVTLGKQGDTRCKYFQTFDNGFNLTALVPNTAYSVSVLPTCSGGSIGFVPPSVKTTTEKPAPTSGPCTGGEGSCYARSNTVNFRTKK